MSGVLLKPPGTREHSPDVLITLDRVAQPSAPLPSLDALYRDHADFVWASLRRMGVKEADLADQLQEVFVVVHRRLESFDGTSKPTTWLYGICLRVASAHRRRAHHHRESLVASTPEQDSLRPSAEEQLIERDAQMELESLLDAMDLERRAVLVMFEIEELPCQEIASLMGIPVGTVHSRLHTARKDFAELHAKRKRSSMKGARP